MEGYTFKQVEKPGWADINAYLNVVRGDEIIGSIGLLSVAAMADAKIKRTNAAIFELNADLFLPFDSRTNEFKHLPQLPLVEKDLSILVDDGISWEMIAGTIRSKVKELEFMEEYRGNQVPEGKKSIMLRFKLGHDDSTMTSEEIKKITDTIIKSLNKRCGAELR